MPDTTTEPLTCAQIGQRVGIVLASADYVGLPAPVEVRYRDDVVGLRVELRTEADYDRWCTWLGITEDAGSHRTLKSGRRFRWAYGTAYDVPVMPSWLEAATDA